MTVMDNVLNLRRKNWVHNDTVRKQEKEDKLYMCKVKVQNVNNLEI